MAVNSETGIPFLSETEVSGEVSELFEEIKSAYQSPFVPNMAKALAISRPALAAFWTLSRSYMEHLTLPGSLVSMISYALAERNNCTYCSAQHELSCRMLGIDEETLAALVKDLGNVSPERIQVIIEFAIKAGRDPKSLVAQDYEKVRRQGITNSEIVEIIMVAAAAVYGDILADALKVDVEPEVMHALAH